MKLTEREIRGALDRLAPAALELVNRARAEMCLPPAAALPGPMRLGPWLNTITIACEAGLGRPDTARAARPAIELTPRGVMLFFPATGDQLLVAHTEGSWRYATLLELLARPDAERTPRRRGVRGGVRQRERAAARSAAAERLTLAAALGGEPVLGVGEPRRRRRRGRRGGRRRTRHAAPVAAMPATAAAQDSGTPATGRTPAPVPVAVEVERDRLPIADAGERQRLRAEAARRREAERRAAQQTVRARLRREWAQMDLARTGVRRLRGPLADALAAVQEAQRAEGDLAGVRIGHR